MPHHSLDASDDYHTPAPATDPGETELPEGGNVSSKHIEYFGGTFDVSEQGEVAREILTVLSEIRESLRLTHRPSTAPPTNESPREYKVLSQKDGWFSQKFDPERLEEAINAYAEQGWIVKSITTASIPGFGGNREELVVVMER